MGTSYNPPIVTDGLVFCVDAANQRSYPKSGTTWSDLVGSNDGTMQNMTASNFSSDNGGSLIFTGTDDYISLGDIFSFGTGDFSIETLVLYNNLSSNIAGATVAKDNYSGSSTYKGFLLNISSGLNFETRNIVGGSGPNTNCRLSQANMSTGRWYFVHANRINNVLKLYVDGVLVDSAAESVATDVSNTHELRVASLSNSSTQRLNGNLSSVKIYNRALTGDEVRQNYEATVGRFT